MLIEKLQVQDSEKIKKEQDSLVYSEQLNMNKQWTLILGLGQKEDNLFQENDSPMSNFNETRQHQDNISVVKWCKQGNYLSLGDYGGRIAIFNFNENSKEDSVDSNYPSLQFMLEFQSHDPEFDFTKQYEVPEKITSIEWLNYKYYGTKPQLLTVNDKIIKLFQIKQTHNFSLQEDLDQIEEGKYSFTNQLIKHNQIIFPDYKDKKDYSNDIRLKNTYKSGHQFHINSISVSLDQENFISNDDICINLWNIENNMKSYNIVNISPQKVEDLQEIITHSEFSKSNCSNFIFSSSKGYICVCDLRQNTKYDKFGLKIDTFDQENKNYFSEIINSVSTCCFSIDSNIVVTRDYMNVKLWDLRYIDDQQKNCIKSYQIFNFDREQLQCLYNNESIFDRFDLGINFYGNKIITGGYNDQFHIIDTENQYNSTISANQNQERLSRNAIIRKYNEEKLEFNMYVQDDSGKNKIQQCQWHPYLDTVAVANQNCIYMYSQK